MITSEERDQQETATADWAKLVNLDYVDTRSITTVDGLTGLLSQTDMYDFGIVPLTKHDNRLEIGLTDRTDRTKLESFGATHPGLDIGLHVISAAGYSMIFNLLGLDDYKPELHGGKFEAFAEKLGNVEPKQIFYLISQLAFEMGASDIHIEPGLADPMVRFRIDGTLHPIATIPRDRYEIALADLQTRSQIKWGTDQPQSGRISDNLINVHGVVEPVNMRIETIPAFHGEEIVIRIFTMDNTYLKLDNLDFGQAQLETIRDYISHPNGMILCVGPTGSGKTSTLYAIINDLNNPETKIVTLEDPVEYEMPGITQIPVRTADSESFADKFRAVMREDPNVIMVGEIRDVDTAKTALQAALTGHLVLSTFHAASAAAGITRIVDMLGTSPLFASSIRIIIAQRLARRVCPHCKQEYKPDAVILDKLKAALHSLPANRRPNFEHLKLYRGQGCPECHGFGFLGRISIREVLVVSPKIEALISGDIRQATTAAIEEIAIDEGMVTLLQDGLLKALEGITSAEEVFRVAA